MLALAKQAIAKFHQTARCGSVERVTKLRRPKADQEQIRRVTEFMTTNAGIHVCTYR
jgi:hypothetical protein